MTINDAVKMWPTPRATDGSKGGRTEEGALKELARGRNVDLGVAVQVWPTPTSRIHKDNGKSPSELNRNSETLAMKAGGQLSPMWVEALMGFPIGWTEIDN
jgi:hypothetical protein